MPLYYLNRETIWNLDILLKFCCIELIDQMILNMRVKDEISPTLMDIASHLDRDHSFMPDAIFQSQKYVDQVSSEANEIEPGSNAFEQCESSAFDDDDPSSVVDDFGREDPTCSSHHEVDSSFIRIAQSLSAIAICLLFSISNVT